MGYSIEFKNKVVSRILSDEISVVDACREYKVSKTALYEWLKQVSRSVSDKGSLRGRDSKQSIPLPRGMYEELVSICQDRIAVGGMMMAATPVLSLMVITGSVYAFTQLTSRIQGAS